MNQIRKTMSMAVMLLLCSVAFSTSLFADDSNTLQISNFSATAGSQQTISVNMVNTASITGLQFDIVLPTGVSIALVDDEPAIDLNTTRTTYKKHSVSCKAQTDGSMRVVCTSMSNAVFSGNSGAVVDVTLNFDNSMTTGDYTVSLKNIELTTPETTQYKTERSDSKVSVTGQGGGEGPSSENTLQIANFSATAGSQQTVSVNMVNTASITGLQFDLVLPTGVSIALVDDEPAIDLNTTRTTYKKHSVSCKAQTDGSMRVVCTSMSNAVFSGNSGAVINITFDFASTMLPGSYTISLKNIELTTPQTTQYQTSQVNSTLTITDPTSQVINVTGITLSQTTATAEVGGTVSLTATVAPENATNKSVTWSSSNESVATVSAEGVVTAVSTGTATITATANDGSGVSASCVVTVEEEKPGTEPSTDISQYDYVLYFNDIEARAGNSLKLELNLKNAAEDITAFECKVVLPDHVTWATTTDKRGNIILVQPTFNTETERTDASYHTISTVKQMTDGSYYIIVYSDAKEYILETDGAVLDIPIVIDDEIESGDYNIILKNLVITKTNTTDVKIDRVVSTLTVPSYELGDANGDTFINVSDIVTVISYMMEENPTSFIFDAADVNLDKLINVTDIVGIIDIMMANANEVKPRMASIKKTASETNKLDYVLKVAPLAVAEGTSDLNATLDLINKEEDITAFECKVYLPEGVEWKSTVDRRGKVILNQPVFNAVEERTDASYHTISTVKQMTDGGYYIIVYSDAKEYILGNSGALLDLPLKLAEGTKAGVYDIKVDGMVITHTDGSDVKPSAYTTSVIVGQPSDIALTGEIKSEAINVYKDAWEKNENLTSLDLCKAFGIADDTEFRFKNPNVLIVVSEGTNIKNENNVVVKSEDEYTCNSLVLTDGKPFAAPANFTATNATYTRDITNLSTICLPYTPSTDNFEYYELTEETVDALRFTKVESPKANTPYLFKKKGTGNTITGSGVEVTTDGAGETGKGKWNMVGTYGPVVLTASDDAYALSGGKLYHNTGTLTVNPFRAYFTNTGSSVKSMDIYLDGEYTGIQMTEEGEFVNRNADTYNMSGQKVDNNYKGVVIRNGVKTLKR